LQDTVVSFSPDHYLQIVEQNLSVTMIAKSQHVFDSS